MRNGTIRGFGYGVYLRGVGNIAERLRADRNQTIGLNVGGENSIVRNNLVVGTGRNASATGIYVTGPGMHVIDNEVMDTVESTGVAYGIRVNAAPGSVVERNVVSNRALGPTSSYGIWVAALSGPAASVVGNRVAYMRDGIYFTAGTLGIYMDNTVGGATTAFSGGTAAGATNFSY